MDQITQTLINDLVVYFKSILSADWTRPLFMMIWIGCLFFPVKNIDIEDRLTALGYIFILSTLGLMLYYPFHNLKEEDFNTKEYVSMYIFFVGVCAVRWTYIYKAEIVKDLIKQGQQNIEKQSQLDGKQEGG